MAYSPPNSSDGTTPFPPIEEGVARTGGIGGSTPTRVRTRDSSGASSRSRSISQKFLESGPPLGFLQATGEAAAKAPSIRDIRRGSYANTETPHEWRLSSTSSEGRRRSSLAGSQAPGMGPRTISQTGTFTNPNKTVPEEEGEHLEAIPSEKVLGGPTGPGTSTTAEGAFKPTAEATTDREVDSKGSSDKAEPEYPTGYHFPPKHTWGQATVIGIKAAWKFTTTPLGFLIVIYGLNVVAWGGMLFLILIPGKGSQFLCHPSCSDINSPRRKWIEIDSQILNALFCVTGFGLIPWRFRDLYYLLQFRLRKNYDGLRRLAGINRGWFRLQGSEEIPVPELVRDTDLSHETPSSAMPLPEQSLPDPPLTGIRAPPTKTWKLDFVIWAYVANTFLQAILSGFMWGYNRYNRPSWSTGLFVALACIVAAAGGAMSSIEGKKVKKIEGVPWGVDDVVADIETAGDKKKGEKSVVEVSTKEKSSGAVVS